MADDIRWKQRFENFEKAFKKLEEAMNEGELNELERNGFIQRYEFTIELAWKTLKDFLQEEGFKLKSPKDVVRQAFQSGYLDDGQVWIDALDIRNKLSHDYNQEYSEEAEQLIRNDIFPAIVHLYRYFITKI